MSLLKGLAKIAGGVVSGGLAGGQHDGPSQICPKCGSIHHGICQTCLSRKSAELIKSGVGDIKSADERIYIEAQKRGFVRASKEYQCIFAELEASYQSVKKNLDSQTIAYGAKALALQQKYNELIELRESLETKVVNSAPAATPARTFSHGVTGFQPHRHGAEPQWSEGLLHPSNRSIRLYPSGR